MIERQPLKSRLAGYLDRLALPLTDQQLEQLIDYLALLVKWNKAYNLTAIREPDAMLTHHLVDSLAIVPHIYGDDIIDVGTGPGIPGIILAIVMPSKRFTLLDSNGKKVRFVTQSVHELGLKNVTPVQARVEAYRPQQGFSSVLSRAFASLKDMVEGCQHLLAEEGKLQAMKGISPEQEIGDLPAAVRVEGTIPLSVPGLNAQRHLINIIKK